MSSRMFVQGPVARVRLRELSFGRSASAKKAAAGVANAVTSFRPRIPLNLRGVEVQLRVPPPPPPGSQHGGKPRTAAAGRAAITPEEARPQQVPQLLAAQPDGGAAPLPSPQQRQPPKASQKAMALARRCLEALLAAGRWAAERLPPLPVHLPLRLAGSMALQLLLALLPSVPVRVKEIEVTFEVRRVLQKFPL